MSKTILDGIRCPNPTCGSFIRVGQEKCEVCGYRLKQEEKVPLEKKAEAKGIVEGEKKQCPKCNTLNETRAKYCKNCREPLQGAVPSRGCIQLHWTDKSPKLNLPSEVNLNPCLPYYQGICEWNGFGFMVYSKKLSNRILIRKINENTSTNLYAKINSTIVVESGTEFYLGAVGFQLLGNLQGESPPAEIQQEKPISTRTVITGPGGNLENILRAGRARVRIMNLDLKDSSIPIEASTVFGRNFLSKNASIGTSLLTELGVSGEHLLISPMAGGSWTLAPMPGKFIYIEISEHPINLAEGSIIRYVGQMQEAVEASLSIKL